MTRVAFGLGSNLGDRAAHLRAAAEGLRAILEDIAVSSFLDTTPVGPPQPRYLNAAVTGRTDRTPEELLAAAQALEARAGRVRTARFGPRTLDVDLLLYGEREIDRPGLVVPHPRLAERAFVLAPLAEIAPDWPVPGTGATVEELLARLPLGC